MRKSNYLWMDAATLLIIIGCTQNDAFTEVEQDNAQHLITFDTYHSKNTKAPIFEDANLTKANGGIGVYAYKYPPLPNSTAASITYDPVAKTIDIHSVAGADNEYTNPVFDNTMVYYNENYNPTPTTVAELFHQKYTYDYPRYWDKLMFYAFFAYAPQMTAVAGTTNPGAANADVFLDVNTGLFTFNTMHEIQRASDAKEKTIGDVKVDQFYVIQSGDADYSTSNNKDIIDYLISPCNPGEKMNATNQSGKNYDQKDLTVGFTFSHLLSTLNVNIKAKEEWFGDIDEDNDPSTPAVNHMGHEYKGIKSIFISKLEIENLPKLTGTDETYLETNYLASCQQNDARYSTDIYNNIFTDNAVVTYTTKGGNQYFTDKLNIVGPGSTESTYAINGYDNQTKPLYILAGGKVQEDANTHELIFTNPGNKDVDGYVDQAFTYYVVPNKPNGTDHYKLNLDYYVEYLRENGTTRLEKSTRSFDLGAAPINFTQMIPGYVYTLSLTIDMDQIYITVEDVEWDNQAPWNITITK